MGTDQTLQLLLLEFGKGRNKWISGHFYREHMLLGDPNSKSWENQIERLDTFLDSVETISNRGNCIRSGDFNINMNPNYNEHYNSELKNKLLDVLPLAGFTQVV